MKRPLFLFIFILSLVTTFHISNESLAQDYKHYLTLTGHTFPVNSIAFSPNGKMIASGGHDGTIRLWDATTGQHKKTLRGHTNYVLCVAFSPNGKVIASGGHDGTIRLWDAITGQHKKTLVVDELKDSVLSFAFSPNGLILASGMQKGWICCWDVAKGIKIETFSLKLSPVRSIAFSPDSLILASGHANKRIEFWNMSIGNYDKNFAIHRHEVHSLVFSPNGHNLAIGRQDGNVTLRSVLTGAEKTLGGSFGFDTIIDDNYTRRIERLSLTERMRDFYVDKGREDTSTPWIHNIAFSPDGGIIASGGRWQIDIHLWNAVTGEPLQILIGHKGAIHSVVFSHDGHTLASASEDGTIRLWKLSTTPIR